VQLSVTALSYDGQFAVSLVADNNMPDLPVLAAGARAAFEGYINGGGHAPESLIAPRQLNDDSSFLAWLLAK
jgi:hypothetical protein